MAKSGYIPHSDGDLLLWHDRFKEAVEALATFFGIVQADLAAVGEDNATLHDTVASVAAHAASAQQATKQKDDARREVEKHVRTLARQLKAHAKYTEAIGEQLGIVGAEQGNGIEAVVVKPLLQLKALPHAVVEIRFQKGDYDGVNLYCTRDGEAGRILLGRATHSPYVDNRPLLVDEKPELRKYRAIYVVKDAEVGDASDDAAATAKP